MPSQVLAALPLRELYLSNAKLGGKLDCGLVKPKRRVRGALAVARFHTAVCACTRAACILPAPAARASIVCCQFVDTAFGSSCR